MKGKKVTETIKAPKGVTFALAGKDLSASGPNGTVTKTIIGHDIKLEVNDNVFIINANNSKRKTVAQVRAIRAHAKNLIQGAKENYIYKLAAVHSHFPLTVKQEGEFIIIKNFTGEKKDRKARVVGETKVEIKGKDIIVTGNNKENVGQTASNLEKATSVYGKDLRVYQDGIYILEKTTSGEKQ